jgi:hemoglobin
MTEASLYERLGGAFAIAAVIDHFSDAVVRNPKVGQGALDSTSPDARDRSSNRSEVIRDD